MEIEQCNNVVPQSTMQLLNDRLMKMDHCKPFLDNSCTHPIAQTAEQISCFRTLWITLKLLQKEHYTDSNKRYGQLEVYCKLRRHGDHAQDQGRVRTNNRKKVSLTK